MKNYTELEIEEKFNKVKNFYKSISESQENPKVYFLGGQPGAGKSALEKMINIQENYISISGDDYRKLHPKFNEFNEKYGKDSSIHTQQWAGEMVEKLVKEMKQEKFNIILEGTLRTSEIPIKEARGFKENGYETELNVIVVKPEKSYLGTIQRYEKMIKDGFQPRMTPKEHHDLVVNNIPKNLEEIYNSKMFDEIKLYDRENNLLYSMEKTPELNPKQILENEFNRKWENQEYLDYKKDFEKVIEMMNERNAPIQEIQEIEKEKDNILNKIIVNGKEIEENIEEERNPIDEILEKMQNGDEIDFDKYILEDVKIETETEIEKNSENDKDFSRE